MITFKPATFLDVPAPEFGEGVVIRVNKRTIKHYVRRITLGKKIDDMKLSPDDVTAHVVAAGLMSICTIPESGEFAFADEQIGDFVDLISADLFTDLSFANAKLNPSEFVQPDVDPTVNTLKAKKKRTSPTV